VAEEEADKSHKSSTSQKSEEFLPLKAKVFDEDEEEKKELGDIVHGLDKDTGYNWNFEEPRGGCIVSPFSS
jgi:hypothetical protein